MADTRKLKVFLKFCVLLGLLSFSKSSSRKINIQRTNCLTQKDNITIVYVTATDHLKKNTVHFIWSVYDTPSVVVGYSSKYNYDPKPTLNVNCNKLVSKDPTKSISWKYDYATAFEISEVDELHDPKDDVIFKDADFAKTKNHQIRETVWKAPDLEHDGVKFEGTFLGGSIVFMLNSSSEDGRGKEAPRQLYSNNGTRFSVTLKGTKFNTTQTRVALKLLTHTEVHPAEKSTISEDRSIDDEYSPGVFRTFVINHVLNNSLSSFVSWKPVSYIKEKKALGSQVPSYQYKYVSGSKYDLYKQTTSAPLETSTKDKPSRVIQASLNVHKTFPLMVSFGQKKDGWYQKNNYLTWAGQVGYYKPQFDSMSKTLMVTIFVGLGLPVLFILIGSLYVCVKKFRERRTTSTYGKIN